MLLTATETESSEPIEHHTPHDKMETGNDDGYKLV